MALERVLKEVFKKEIYTGIEPKVARVFAECGTDGKWTCSVCHGRFVFEEACLRSMRRASSEKCVFEGYVVVLDGNIVRTVWTVVL
ncbi:MAG: hypothetical protein WC846_01180 [Candidatus Gracilibacteria bacterium]|jgi:hypothetical protein